ncbi:uncharacterized protein LOC116308754 [Actinia tenebrosa]|uniref:Uncharacterized protein LOC116308754 n=1 Tax=Actinia tenebrosa TaxID=6105 RepID=A0A6P8J5V1_ACTTE|nr:uncharacterized protein LOC116308754 [Actinia tenebrosa]
MAVICGIVTAAIFQLLIGLASTGYGAYIVFLLAGVDLESNQELAVVAYSTLWMSLIAFGVTTLSAGIIGCIAGCQRGQCVVLTYMASCILCCLSSFEVIVIGALYVVNLCGNGNFKECTKEVSGIFWIVVLACALFMFLISLIGSGFACRARCYCCTSPGDVPIDHDPNLMVLTTNPSAPTLGEINSGHKY